MNIRVYVVVVVYLQHGLSIPQPKHICVLAVTILFQRCIMNLCQCF